MSKIEDLVIDKIKKRASTGYAKYGVTMERDDLGILDWLTHKQEELMDGAVYSEKIKEYIQNILHTPPRNLSPYVDSNGFENSKKNFELYLSFKDKNEHVGIANVPLTQVSTFPYDDEKSLFEAKEFFNFCYSKESDLANRPASLNSVFDINHNSVTRFTRLLMLTKHYNLHKQFNDLTFGYRDKLEGKFRIHPGHGRNFVYRLFSNKDRVKMLYWDYKKDKDIEYLTEFTEWNQLDSTFNDSDLTCGLIPSYDSLYPCIYVTKSLDGYRTELIQSEFDYADYFKNIRIKANFNLDIFGYIDNNHIDNQKTINLTVKNHSTRNYSKAILATVLENYEDNDIIISS